MEKSSEHQLTPLRSGAFRREPNDNYYRFLFDKHVRYVSIAPGVLSPSVVTWDVALLPLLPEFPPDDWNVGRIIENAKDNRPDFAWTERDRLPSIEKHMASRPHRRFLLEIRESERDRL